MAQVLPILYIAPALTYAIGKAPQSALYAIILHVDKLRKLYIMRFERRSYTSIVTLQTALYTVSIQLVELATKRALLSAGVVSALIGSLSTVKRA